jgi:heme oxygenase
MVGPRLGLLRAATAEAHQSVEARLLLLGPALDQRRYAEYLGALLCVVEPIEQALLRVEGIEHAWPDIRGRQKAPQLRRDLAELGQTVEDVSGTEPTAAIRDVATALGIGYVLEGSTLGGEVLRREIVRRLGPVPTWYFTCYGGELRARWVAFLAQLEAARLDEPETQLVDGAHFAFTAVERTLTARGLLR